MNSLRERSGKVDTYKEAELDRVASDEKADQALFSLGEYLHESGYQFTAVTPATHETNNRRHSNRPANTLRDIFGWSRPFERTTLTDQAFDLMHDAGILEPVGGLWRSSLRWSRLSGLLCAHSAYPTDASDAVFFGPDTYRFAQVIESQLQSREQPMERAVDIGCGSGAGAILIARSRPKARVLAVDINSKALRLTRINAQLARAPNVEPAHSNLLADVSGSFDLIVANPPYMMDAQERAYRHGGGELGEGLSIRIVEEALLRLAPGGTLLLYTGVAIVGGEDPFLQILQQRLHQKTYTWRYREIDPDVFGEELARPAYERVERIAAVALILTRPYDP